MKSKIGKFTFSQKKEFEDIPFSSKNGDHSGWFGLVVLICKDIALCKLGISYKKHLKLEEAGINPNHFWLIFPWAVEGV